jgi:hypothetical protein
MGIFDKSRKNVASHDSVTFYTSRYAYQGERDGARIWFLPEGGGFGLYLFQKPPDLPPKLASTIELRDFYTRSMGDGMKVVECRILSLDEIPAVWLIGKTSEALSGAGIYVGSITIPFRDFSFVIKMQCHEHGVTGMREALLVAEALRNGTGRVEGDKFVLNEGISFDDEQFDAKIPKHPLSRVRRELRTIADSLRIDASVKKQPGFLLPPVSS